MSNLIPTPIVDKNGVPSIRHKKPTAAKVQKKGGIPRVATMGNSPAHNSQLNTEQLVNFIYPDMRDEMLERERVVTALELIREHSSGELDLGLELMRTGSETASELVRKEIDFNVTSISIVRSRENYYRIDENVKSSAQLDPITLRQAWNCGNVMDESGFTDDTGIPGRMKNISRQELRRELPKLDYQTTDDSFWRGITAFTIIDTYAKTDDSMSDKQKAAAKLVFYREAKKFFAYAGKHKDIGLVIRTAQKHGTIVVSDLKDIITRGDVAPAMREGAL